MLKPVQSIKKSLKDQLTQFVGADNLSQDEKRLSLFSQDVYKRADHTVGLVVSPSSTKELSQCVAAVTAAGHAAIPRGAGMSYTSGYLPPEPEAVSFDFSRMDRILKINEDDMTVTVEAGCSWSVMYEALKEKGLRTPFWGPLSGLTSTIGGGLSQNNAFFGAGTYGSTADSVLSLKVITADGTVIETGSLAKKNGTPFFRHFGPDLTGLFIGDTGALGFKAEVTFKLMHLPPYEDYASFEFENKEATAEAASKLSRAGLGCEVFGFDPNLQLVRMKRMSLAADVKSLGKVVAKQKNVLGGIKEAAKIVTAGRNFLDKAAYSLHVMAEGRSKAGVADDMAAIRQIVTDLGGKEAENTIPKVMRAQPFMPLNTMIGPEGERWVPIHGIVPHSKAQATWEAIDQLFESMSDEFEKNGVLAGYLITTLGTTGFLIEPVFLWPDALDQIHLETVEKPVLDKVKGYDRNPASADSVAKARQGILDIFAEQGATHFQIGRTYPYAEGIKDEPLALISQVKKFVDPENRINPGALGL